MSTSTPTQPPQAGSPAKRAGAAPGLAPAVRRQRRPGAIAGGIALIAVTGIGGGAFALAAGDTQPVVALASTVMRGEVIKRDDLRIVDVGGDPSLQLVSGEQLASIVGKRAATDLPAGTLLPANVATTELVPRRGRTLVGLQLKPSQLPATTLQSGDTVRLVTLPADQAASSRPGASSLPISATVIGSQDGPDGQSTRVDVEVPNDVAAALSVSAATGRVALVLDSRER